MEISKSPEEIAAYLADALRMRLENNGDGCRPMETLRSTCLYQRLNVL
jgi:hypothetical protein